MEKLKKKLRKLFDDYQKYEGCGDCNWESPNQIKANETKEKIDKLLEN